LASRPPRHLLPPDAIIGNWQERPEWREWAEQTEGCYILRTNVTHWSAEDLWRTYIQLTDAEAAFRIQKSDLSIRPIWHQRGDRVCAHIFVCSLAYVLWKTLERWQDRAGLGHSPRTILHELRRIQSTDVVLTAVWTAANCGCAAWSGPTRPRPPSSIVSAWTCPNGSGRRNASKCSANFWSSIQ
jgi:hypothetical protein